MVRISIITVCYNAEAVLEGTLLSVLNQTYPHIEYIVIDGNSKDGTRALIEKYASYILPPSPSKGGGDGMYSYIPSSELSRSNVHVHSPSAIPSPPPLEGEGGRSALGKSPLLWISEPDQGIYDAMTKGQRLATGDFVWFINAGDRLFAPDTVEKAVAQLRPDTDVFYGEVMLVDENRTHLSIRSEATTQKLPNPLTWKNYRLGMVVCHQGIAVRRSIAPDYLPHNLSADIDWSIRALKQARHVVATNLIVAEYLKGGISKQKHQQSLLDRFAILQTHFGLGGALWGHFLIVVRAVVFRVRRIGKEHY
jgi:glycosyltransferase involved in cell wall biosynthesis